MTRIYDEAGRHIADEPDAAPARPMGPWDANTAPAQPEPLRVICAWCPDFDRTNPANAGASHGMCPTCKAKMDAQLDAMENSK